MENEPNLEQRIAERIAELDKYVLRRQLAWRAGRGVPFPLREEILTKAEIEELAILTYRGPVPRRLPFSDEVPF